MTAFIDEDLGRDQPLDLWRDEDLVLGHEGSRHHGGGDHRPALRGCDSDGRRLRRRGSHGIERRIARLRRKASHSDAKHRSHGDDRQTNLQTEAHQLSNLFKNPSSKNDPTA